MKRMKTAYLLLTALAVVGLTLPALAGGDLTLLVVPARYSVLQVAFDVANRFPAVLVSYQGDAKTEAPRMDAWNGEEWVRISQQDYDQLSFLQVTPSRAVLVGDETLLPPSLSAPLASWCSRVETIGSVDTTALVNELGKVFGFRPADWKWFSSRYNLTLTDANEELERTSWYDQKNFQDEYTQRWRARHGRRGGKNAPAVEVAPETIAPVAEPVVEQAPAPDMAPAEVMREPAAPQGWEEKAVSPESDIK
jgi:hypothetical protein